MFVQEKFGLNIGYLPQKKIRHKPSYKKENKIKETLKEWNTIPDIELYKPLYDICSQLFFATQTRHLENLNYYIDTENDGKGTPKQTIMYAEIKDTWQLPLKDRYNKHLELLERVMSNDTTLIYCSSEDNLQEDFSPQRSLFSASMIR